MNGKRFADNNILLNEAQQAAADVAGALELLSILYGTLSIRQPPGADERMLAATFSTIQAQAAKVAKLLDEALA